MLGACGRCDLISLRTLSCCVYSRRVSTVWLMHCTLISTSASSCPRTPPPLHLGFANSQPPQLAPRFSAHHPEAFASGSGGMC